MMCSVEVGTKVNFYAEINGNCVCVISIVL